MSYNICVFLDFWHLKEKVKFVYFLPSFSIVSLFFFKRQPLLFLPSEGPVPPPSINATIKASSLLVLDLTSHPSLPNASTSPPSAPAVVNKEQGVPLRAHPSDPDCLVNNLSDVTLPRGSGRHDKRVQQIACE